jgi:hypothetical protein
MKSFSEHLLVDSFNPVGIKPVFDLDHRVREFGSLDEIAEAGFPVKGYVYRAAAKQFSQSPHIGKVFVGWKVPGGVYDVRFALSAPLQAGNIAHLTINATTVDVAFDTVGSSEGVIDELVKQANEELGDQAMALKPDPLSIRFYGANTQAQLTISGGTTQPTVIIINNGRENPSVIQPVPADVTWTEALSAIKSANNDWYAISVSSRMMINQQEIAQWIQANEKLGILTSGDYNLANEESGDIAAWAKLNNLDRVSIFYHPDSKLENSAQDKLAGIDPIPEAAWFGKMLTKHPGSATWKFKELQSVPTYELTQGQVSQVEKKNANWYMTTADVPMTSDGRTAAGEYIDVIHGLDWLKARIQNLVFTPMAQQDKIPYTDAGVQIIVSSLRAALDEGVKYSILASYEITYPAVAEIAQNWKAERTLPDVNFTGVLTGAIHRTIINGTITL